MESQYMKQATFTVEFTSHCLASGNADVAKNYDTFHHTSDGSIIFSQSWFYSAFDRAIRSLRVSGVKPGDICMKLNVKAPVEVYTRRYSVDKFRTHEAIMPGTKVTFKALVEDHVTQSILDQILQHVGDYVGISPYGFKLGYGKFNLLGVEVESSEK